MSVREDLERAIEYFCALDTKDIDTVAALEAFLELRNALEIGTVRAAEPDITSFSGWRVNAWVKRGILLGYRLGTLQSMNGEHAAGESILSFVEKSTFPVRHWSPADGVRIVPGGSSVRSGAHLAAGVIVAPPAFINVGAFVGEGSMVDSHALVGSCAQIGKRVHLSAAAQIGGVLEPVSASPVIIEDDVLVGGNSGVYEGTVVRARAVLGAGTVLTHGTVVFDLPNNRTLRATPDGPLIIPADAVVVPGSRAITTSVGKDYGLSLYTPIIVKYRDEKTNLSTALEELVR